MGATELEEQFFAIDAEESGEDWRLQLQMLLERASASGERRVARWCVVRLAVYAEAHAEFPEALRMWQQLVELDASDAIGSLGVARTLARVGKVKESVAGLQSLLAREHLSGELGRLARSMLRELEGAARGERANAQPSAPLPSEYEPGDIGVLYDVLAHATSLAGQDPSAAEAQVYLLLERAKSMGDSDAVAACEFALATEVIREPRRRIARCRTLLRRSLEPRGRAHLLIALAVAEEAVGWIDAAQRHREEAQTTAAGDVWCERSLQQIWNEAHEDTSGHTS